MTSVFLDQMIAVGDPVSYIIDEMALFTSKYSLFTNNTFIQNIFCKDLFTGSGGGNLTKFQTIPFPSQSNAVTCSNNSSFSNLSSLSTVPQPVGCTNGFLNIMSTYFAKPNTTTQYIADQGTNIYINTYGAKSTNDRLTSPLPPYAYPANVSFSLSNSTTSPNYLHDSYVLNIITDVVAAHYVNMVAGASANSLPNSFKLQNNLTTNSISIWLQDLCNTIFNNVSPSNPPVPNSFSIYFQNILKQYDLLCPSSIFSQYTISTPTTMRNIFAILMFPYFVFKYIIQNIGEFHATSSQKAPRIFILRRYAIGCAYLFEYFLNKFNAKSCQSNDSNINYISDIMRSINTNQQSEDSNDYLTEIVNLRQETIQNNTNANNIAGLNNNVIQARNNLQKAITNDIKVIPRVKYSIVYLVFSIIMFCIILIVCPLLIYFAAPTKDSKLLKYMYIFCAINIFWLVISGIIQIIRNM